MTVSERISQIIKAKTTERLDQAEFTKRMNCLALRIRQSVRKPKN